MADKQMHHLTIGEDTFEIVDQVARAGGSGAGVPSNVRQAISTLLQAAAYTETGLTDEIAIVEAWASVATAISVTPSTASINGSGTQQLTAVTTPSGKSVSWTSSDTSVATVSSGGLVTGVGNGTATITATSGSVSAMCTVTVTGFANLTSISAVYTQSGTVYDTDTLDSLRDDLVVTASYDDSSTATISSDYTLSGTLTEGTSTITVTYDSCTATFTVTVTASLMNMNFLFSDITLSDGYIGDDGSVVSTSDNLYYDEFIPAVGFAILTSSGTAYSSRNLYYRLAEYDSSNAFISRKASGNVSLITADNDPAYIKMGFNNSTLVQSNADRLVALNVLDTRICTIADSSIDTSGTVITSSGTSISDFLPVEDGYVFCKLSNRYDSALVVYYDSSYEFISRHAVTSSLTDYTSITAVPSNAAYVRFRVDTSPNSDTYVSYFVK